MILCYEGDKNMRNEIEVCYKKNKKQKRRYMFNATEFTDYFLPAVQGDIGNTLGNESSIRNGLVSLMNQNQHSAFTQEVKRQHLKCVEKNGATYVSFPPSPKSNLYDRLNNTNSKAVKKQLANAIK